MSDAPEPTSGSSDGSSAQPSGGHSGAPPHEPSFLELLLGNLRLLRWVALIMVAAYGIWRALVWLFPDFAWLRIPDA